MQILKTPLRFLVLLCSALINGLRPFLGPTICKYPFTCTRFALHQLETAPFFTALWRIVKRVASCNPLC